MNMQFCKIVVLDFCYVHSFPETIQHIDWLVIAVTNSDDIDIDNGYCWIR